MGAVVNALYLTQQDTYVAYPTQQTSIQPPAYNQQSLNQQPPARNDHFVTYRNFLSTSKNIELINSVFSTTKPSTKVKS